MPTTLYINSRNRTSGTSSDFGISIPKEKIRDATRVAVTQISIPKSFYIIQPKHNAFILREDDQEIEVTVPIGNYSRKTFRNVLVTQLNALSPHGWYYSIIIPSAPDTGKFTYTVTGNGGIQPVFIFTSSKMWERMGFEKESINPFIGDILISPNVISLIPEQTLFLRSNLITSDGDNILQPVFANADPSFSSINFVSSEILANSRPLASNITLVAHFYLTDEDGDPIDLNGVNFVFALVFF